MTVEIGYLLPTRERIMSGANDVQSLLGLAERAEHLGFDGIWIGDSLTARPRHEPLAVLAAVAARVPRVKIGTAVLLPALRNPVLLAHQAATIDQIAEGRLVLGMGIARDVPSIRAEFEAAGVPFDKRVGRLLEAVALMRALWTGEPVTWDGRWRLHNARIGPLPHRKGGPPLWLAGSLPQSLERVGRHFDGWLPNDRSAESFAEGLAEIKRIAMAAGRDRTRIAGAMYLTLSLDENAELASSRLDHYLESYYGAPPAALRKRQECFAGPAAGLAPYLAGFAKAGARHLIVRFAGDQVAHLEAVARVRREMAA